MPFIFHRRPQRSFESFNERKKKQMNHKKKEMKKKTIESNPTEKHNQETPLFCSFISFDTDDIRRQSKWRRNKKWREQCLMSKEKIGHFTSSLGHRSRKNGRRVFFFSFFWGFFFCSSSSRLFHRRVITANGGRPLVRRL